MRLSELSRDELTALHAEQTAAYDALVAQGLKLDLTRGKPSPAQLDLSNGLLTLPGEGDYTRRRRHRLPQLRRHARACRELREIFAAAAQRAGRPAGGRRQRQPGDHARHAGLLAAQGHRRLRRAVGARGRSRSSARCPATTGTSRCASSSGSTMDPGPAGRRRARPGGGPRAGGRRPERQGHLDRADLRQPDRRGVLRGGRPARWSRCRPPRRTSGSSGTTRTPCTTSPRSRPRRWTCSGLAAEAGNPNRVVPVRVHLEDHLRRRRASRSSPRSPANVAWYLQHLGKRTIGPDKVNHLRHARLPEQRRRRARADAPAPRDHRAEVRAGAARSWPSGWASYEAATWTDPEGGYFISLDVADGTATRVVALAKEAGIAMTGAGAAFPYGKDPRDRNIRIAPTLPVAGRRGRRDRGAVPPACCWPRPSSGSARLK